MEEILNKLSEIENAARGIMEDADRSKQTLSEEMEKKQKAFDSRLEQETDARIEQIRSDLEREKRLCDRDYLPIHPSTSHERNVRGQCGTGPGHTGAAHHAHVAARGSGSPDSERGLQFLLYRDSQYHYSGAL